MTEPDREEVPAAFASKEKVNDVDGILAKIEAEIANKRELIAKIEDALNEKDELDAKLSELAERANGTGIHM